MVAAATVQHGPKGTARGGKRGEGRLGLPAALQGRNREKPAVEKRKWRGVGVERYKEEDRWRGVEERSSRRLEAALSAGGGPVNHSLLSRYVTNSTSAISVTWRSHFRGLSTGSLYPERSGSFDLFFWRGVNGVQFFFLSNEI